NSRGSPVLADGKIFVGEVNSKFHIVDVTKKKPKSLHAEFFPAIEGVADVEINGSPAVANGRVYFATSDEFYCIGAKDAKPAPGQVTIPSIAKAGEVTHLQLVPA